MNNIKDDMAISLVQTLLMHIHSYCERFFFLILRFSLLQGVPGEGEPVEPGGVRLDVQMRGQGAARPDHPDPGPRAGIARFLSGQRRDEVLRPAAARRILSVERWMFTYETYALRRAELFACELVHLRPDVAGHREHLV